MHRHVDHDTVDIEGIDKHRLLKIPLCTVGGVAKTQLGEVILVMHQYANTGKGPTIHSAGQIKHFGNEVDDRSKIVNGRQRLVASQNSVNYVFPLDVVCGLVQLQLCPYTDTELKVLPQVVLTSDVQ